MKISKIVQVLFLGFLFLAFGRGSQAQSVKLIVHTKECTQGILMHPVDVSVAVFDVTKVPEIIQLEKDYEVSVGRMNEDGPEKAESAYAILEKRVNLTPALARSKRLSKSEIMFDLPTVHRIIIFSFGEREYESIYAKQELELIPGKVNSAILNFSTEEECKSAK